MAQAPLWLAVPCTPCLAAVLAPSRPLHSATLRVANMVCDGFRPARLFCALGGALKVLVLVLAPDMDVAHARAVVRRARKYRRGSSFSSSLAASAVQAGRLAVFERAGSSHTPPVAKVEEGPSSLVLWR
ncbi:hypothetical protein EDB85DRAFT_2033842 [Lactarius pseudohatsudake]|nr:hypothetical protein EDB85DRAFT_2033842 [Lactarius pseudohatsudake]